MSWTIGNIREQAFNMQEQLVSWRRELHALAEPAFQEKKTSAYLESKLQELGLEVITRAGSDTGLLAFCATGDSSAPTVALRADMDALPIEEKTGLPFACQEGYMHACGHDAHMAMALGAAAVWKQLPDPPPGNLLLIFQPAEECPPGGALTIIGSGHLERFSPRAIFGLHVNPLMDVGSIGLKSGPLMAAADSFTLKVIGQGGHGAAPHHCVDPITTASSIIQAWQQLASRQVDPLEPIVVSIGSIHGGQQFNIIAEEVELKGTVRTLNESLRESVPSMLETMANRTAEAFGARCEFSYQRGFPVLYNDEEKTALVRDMAGQLLNEQDVIELPNPFMGGEDMAYFLQRIPGCYFLLGTRPEGVKNPYPWHSPHFDLNEKALPYGTALLTACAARALTAVSEG